MPLTTMGTRTGMGFHTSIGRITGLIIDHTTVHTIALIIDRTTVPTIGFTTILVGEQGPIPTAAVSRIPDRTAARTAA